MRFLSRLFMAIHVGMYRLSGGRIWANNVLLLTTTGRKSGKVRTVPLGCFNWQGGYLIVASNGGAPNHPGWYHNLKGQPQVKVQVLDKVMTVNPQVLTGEDRSQAWQHVINAAPGYAGHEKKTTREIPLVLLLPER